MEDAIRIVPPEERAMLMNNYEIVFKRGSLVTVSSSDWHFGAMDPKYQYDTLEKGLFSKIEQIHFDVFFILGDIYDHKLMANSDAIMYSSLAVKRLVDICKSKGATLVILAGTESHDANQLKLFYHYLQDPYIDIRIVERLCFQYIKGAKVLCIPEEYNMGAEYYNKFLFMSGNYDMAIMHGMYKNAVYGATDTDKNTNKAPIFEISDFCNCSGLILSGHVHVAGCFNTYFYYTGTPYRWCFGEEQDKGFMITLLDLDTGQHYNHFETIDCLKYVTINLDDILGSDPDHIVNYIKEMKETQNIDFLRVRFKKEPTEEQAPVLEVLRKYFRGNTSIRIEIANRKREQIVSENKEVLEKYKDYDYILDSSLSPYEIFVKYVNHQVGYEYISVEDLMEILHEE